MSAESNKSVFCIILLFLCIFISSCVDDSSKSTPFFIRVPSPEYQQRIHWLAKIISKKDTVTEHTKYIAEKVYGTAYWISDVDAELVARVIRVESSGDSMAISRVGAVGLGQIRPEVWTDEFPFCGDNLFRVRDNICYTAQILSRYKKRFHTWENTLLSYVGCRHKHPSCIRYPDKVLYVSD